MSNQISSKITALTFGILVILFAVSFYIFAWQEPSQTPPSGNVAAPLNIGSTAQTKAGPLTVADGGGDALILRNGGDFRLYNTDNSGSALLYTDNNGEIITPGNLKAGSLSVVGGASLPTCDSSARGKLSLLQSGSGVEDGLYVCKKKTDGTYGWIALASPTIIEACTTLGMQNNKNYIPTTFPNQNFKRFFVTSGQWNGNLGGLAGADVKCQAEAISRGYGSTWKALLGDMTTTGLSRINNGIFVSPTPTVYNSINCYEVLASNKSQLVSNPNCKIRPPRGVWAQNLAGIYGGCYQTLGDNCGGAGCHGAGWQCGSGYSSVYFNACNNWTLGTQLDPAHPRNCVDDGEGGCYLPYIRQTGQYMTGNYGCQMCNGSCWNTDSYPGGMMSGADGCTLWGYGGEPLEGQNICYYGGNCSLLGNLFCVEQ